MYVYVYEIGEILVEQKTLKVLLYSSLKKSINPQLRLSHEILFKTMLQFTRVCMANQTHVKKLKRSNFRRGNLFHMIPPRMSTITLMPLILRNVLTLFLRVYTTSCLKFSTLKAIHQVSLYFARLGAPDSRFYVTLSIINTCVFWGISVNSSLSAN